MSNLVIKLLVILCLRKYQYLTLFSLIEQHKIASTWGEEGKLGHIPLAFSTNNLGVCFMPLSPW